MLLVDTHAHLDHPWLYKDLDKIIARAKEAGVKAIITSGITYYTNRIALKIAKNYDIVRCSLGLYPQDAMANELKSVKNKEVKKKANIDEELDFIKKNKNRIIAIGEIGMDLKTGSNEKEQKQLFLRQLELAEMLKKPVIIHSRKAEQQVIEILESTKNKKIMMHCFGGRLKLAKKAADNGWSFSIPTNIVKSEHFQHIVREVNINQLLTETDAPYLSPFTGKTNEPAFVAETIGKIAQIKGFEAEEVANNIFLNYKKLFE